MHFIFILPCLLFFIRPFEKRERRWRAGWRAASTGFPLSKSKSFHPVFIKFSKYVGGHNISTKFYNQPNPHRHSWIMALELSKNWVSDICSPSRISCSPKCCHYRWIYHKYDGHILCQFGPLVKSIICLKTSIQCLKFEVLNLHPYQWKQVSSSIHDKNGEIFKTKGPNGPWVTHLRKRSKVTVESQSQFTEDH